MTDLLQTLLDDAVGLEESDADDVFGDNADRAEERNEELTEVFEPIEQPAEETQPT